MTTFRSRMASGLVVVLVLGLSSGTLLAQSAPGALSPLQISVACAPPPELAAPHADAIRVAGAQDTVARSLFDERDLLILDGGTDRGLALGQEYFLRRPAGYAPALSPGAHGVQTAGWIRVVAVNQATAIGMVEHACGAILQRDYLEPFSVPTVPDVSPGPAAPDGLDFSAPARVLFSADDRPVAGVAEFMLIDHGTKQGVSAGTRFAIYRDLRSYSLMPLDMTDKLPLASIADAVVVSAGADSALIRIGNARDAVHGGDMAVPRK